MSYWLPEPDLALGQVPLEPLPYPGIEIPQEADQLNGRTVEGGIDVGWILWRGCLGRRRVAVMRKAAKWLMMKSGWCRIGVGSGAVVGGRGRRVVGGRDRLFCVSF